MANLHKPIAIERHGPGCADPAKRRRPAPPHEAGRPALGTGFQDFYAGRFRLALWLLERHSRSGAQRTRAALMLVLGNVLLAILALLLCLLAMLVMNGTTIQLVLGCLSLILVCVLLSTIFALLAAARWRLAESASPADPSGIFQSGYGMQASLQLVSSEADFREQFNEATRQQVLEGAISALYSQVRHRVRQERWFRWAGLAFALGLALLVLMTSIWVFIGIIL